jgi:hypothetical protein
MRNQLVVLLLITMLAACSAGGPERLAADPAVVRPSDAAADAVAATSPMPMGSFFYSLPNYDIGQTVTLDGYTATVNEVVLESDQLEISIDITNESAQAIDMVWGLQLIRDEVGYVPPQSSPVQDMAVGETVAAETVEVGGVWSYDLSPGDASLESPVNLDDYRLLFVPRGWSGPVFVFHLTPPTQ